MSEAAPVPKREAQEVFVVGAAGRLGRLACEVVEADPGLRLTGRFRSSDDWLPHARPEAIAFEATRAGLGFAHARALLERGVRPVVATSGVSREELEALDRLAREARLGGRVVPNLSFGAWVLERAVRLAASGFPELSILETHHPQKRDAPSGTAKHLAAIVEDGTGRRPSIRSLREEGAYAEHQLRLEAQGEVLLLEHRMSGPRAFAQGIRFALRLAAGDEGVQLGLPWEQVVERPGEEASEEPGESPGG